MRRDSDRGQERAGGRHRGRGDERRAAHVPMYLNFCFPTFAASPFATASSLSTFSMMVVVHSGTLPCTNV